MTYVVLSESSSRGRQAETRHTHHSIHIGEISRAFRAGRGGVKSALRREADSPFIAPRPSATPLCSKSVFITCKLLEKIAKIGLPYIEIMSSP